MRVLYETHARNIDYAALPRPVVYIRCDNCRAREEDVSFAIAVDFFNRHANGACIR